MNRTPQPDESQRASGYHLRPSRVLRKIRSGGVALCFKHNLADPRAVEIAASAGYDCVWLCQEHVPSDNLAVENMIRAAKIYDVDAVVRAARGSYSDYIRGLEMDAAGIMVPHVMGLEDATRVVQMTKFPPLGRRAVDGGNADGGYTRVELQEYLEASNRERFVIFQIEDPEPLDQVEAIAELPGVDMLFFGPGDFSVAVGKPGRWDDPDVTAAGRRVVAAAVHAGKIAGTVTRPGGVREWADLGCRFLAVGADVVGLGQYVERLMAQLSEALTSEVPTSGPQTGAR